MNEKFQAVVDYVDAHKQPILDAERYIWKHPQVGYTEWEAHNYLKERFEALGYELTLAGNIPGFFTDIDTGRPGPMLCIMGELDALDIANHPESVNGMTHCCGHNCQASAMLGVAIAMKTPGFTDGLSGKIRLMLVPAEEAIQLEFREGLRAKGEIHYLEGKPEFMYRGYFDDVDLCIMVHTGVEEKEMCFGCSRGSNGLITKNFTFTGNASHAGSPEHGVNAEYASILAFDACNALRETFPDKDTIRWHPIMHGISSAVNIIPDEVKMESYVRGKNFNAIKRENDKINRALAGAALSIGANVEIHDRPGCAPEIHDLDFMRLIEKVCVEMVGRDKVLFHEERFGTGSSDFGDLTTVMPGVQFRAYGAQGTAHGINYYVVDPERAVVNPGKAQALVAIELLKDDAAAAKQIVANYKPQFSSIQEYIDAMDNMTLDVKAVTYNDDGTATVRYAN